MSRETERLLGKYSKAIGRLSESYRKKLVADLQAIDWSDITAGANEAVDIMLKATGKGTSRAAHLSAKLYDSMRKAEVGEILGAVAESGFDAEKLEDDVRGMVGDILDGKPRTVFESKCASRFGREVNNAGKHCIGKNAKNDKLAPRYAVVPQGDCCTFCAMLASRGAVYRDPSDCEDLHDHCTCCPAPAWGMDKDGNYIVDIEGYDPGVYERAWREMESIDGREDLTGAEKDMLKSAVLDREVGFGTDGARSLADKMESAVGAAIREYDRDKTETAYNASVNKVLAEIGDVYGMRISGEYQTGKGLASAMPNGEEVWAVTRLRGIFDRALFLGTDYQRSGNPDVFIGGAYADIKTPRGLRRTARRLNEAAIQCRAVGQDDGIAILSSLKYSGDFSQAVSIAREFVQNKSLAIVYTVQPGIEVGWE